MNLHARDKLLTFAEWKITSLFSLS